MSASKSHSSEANARVAAEDKAVLSERILNELYGLYNDPAKYLNRAETSSSGQVDPFGKVGLVDMAKAARLNPPLITPRRRVTVLIIGNHSAGKSSFINYYVEESVQGTGVAVESTGFTIIRSGREDQDVRGEGALVDNEHIGAVADRLGIDRDHFVENLSLVVRTSTAKDFANIDFIDTPGLCDGEITYPFDVNKCICELAQIADLILVFLDPVGKAQVSRTMDVVELLSRKHQMYDRMRFYLTKADTADSPQDLNKVVAQLSHHLAKRLYNTHGFEVPPMWIPQQASHDALAARGFLPEHNGVTKLLNDIKKVINTKVQSNMTTCQKDCKRIIDHIDADIIEEHRRRGVRRTWECYVWMLGPWFIVLGLLTFFDVLVAVKDLLPRNVHKAPFVTSIYEVAEPVVGSLGTSLHLLGAESIYQRLLVYAGLFFLVSVLVQFFRCRTRLLRVRSLGEVNTLRTHQAHAEVMCKHVTDLYQRYVRAAQTPEYDPNNIVPRSAKKDGRK